MATIDMSKLPRIIDGGKWDTGHVQGITVDTAHEYIYFSFTTKLIKTDMQGNVVGSVTGLLGHLGCIDFNDEDGKVYGSLELKHDSIGQGIMKKLGVQIAEEDSFYISIFDVDKIDRMDMDAEKDGIMTAVYLPEVVEDYMGKGADGKDHHYACSGIDGTAFGPVFGAPADSPHMLMVAYGIYGDNDRADNDNNIILQFDWRKFADVAKPLIQGEPHHSGIRADFRYFLPTGNTTWGIQNLEYDAFTGDWLVAVYLGKKPEYPNYPMYVIDGRKPGVMAELKGLNGEWGLTLSLRQSGAYHKESGVWGWTFPKGQTGIYSLGNGYFYVSHNGRTPEPEKLQTSVVYLYRYTGNAPQMIELVED